MRDGANKHVDSSAVAARVPYRRDLWVFASVGCLAAVSCNPSPGDSSTYTLYRSSVANDTLRVHVATFDAADGERYNRDSCEYTRGLYQAQPGIKTRFWCEKGRHRK